MSITNRCRGCQGLHRLFGNGSFWLLVLAVVGLSRCNPGPVGGGNEQTVDDGVPSGEDDCSVERDPDGDGIAELCVPPDDAVFSFVAGDGALRLSVDQRLRPVQLVSPEETTSFVWSEDSTSAEITIQSGGDIWTLIGEADFSDEGTLASIAEVETETGFELVALRDWIAAHPGQVEATARGEQEAAQPPADVSTAVVSKLRPIYQSNVHPNVRRHLDMIAGADIKVVDTWNCLYAQRKQAELNGQDDLVDILSDLLEHFQDLRYQLSDYLIVQTEACGRCTVSCLVDCSPLDSGACCYSEGGRTRCEDNMRQVDCFARENPVFHDGLGCGAGGTDACLSGCCISVTTPDGGILECCQNLLPETCRGIQINGSDVGTLFSYTRRCGDPLFLCSVCSP